MPRILLFLLFSFSIPLSAQQVWTIEAVEFEGLKKTKPSFLKKFIQSKEDQVFITKQLQNDIQRLKNLSLHYPITAEIDSLPNQKVKITFQFTEKKTLLPIINLGGIRENIWYQVGFTDFNFLGRGHQFLAFYQNSDKRSGGQLFYRVPYLNKKWGLALSLGGSIFQEFYKKNENQTLLNPPGPEELSLWKTSSKVEYIDSRINYDDFYLEGISWRGIWQTVYTFDNKSLFNSLIFQVRKFKRFGRNGNLAARLRFGISTNNDSPFAPFVVDSRVNLRGSGNRIERGTGQLILNIEYRQTIRQLNNWAFQGVVFSDLGNWRSPGGTLNEFFERKELRQFVGGGFRLIYRRIFNSIIRVDGIFNIEGKETFWEN